MGKEPCSEFLTRSASRLRESTALLKLPRMAKASRRRLRRVWKDGNRVEPRAIGDAELGNARTSLEKCAFIRSSLGEKGSEEESRQVERGSRFDTRPVKTMGYFVEQKVRDIKNN
ncbi:hypothetical protein KM043_003646 [Ampulex compressa]|nr:hypothetical protein KM043_003646 [Ampulex compressa]